ncbi:Nucleotide-diphospho-sugar transferase [Quillaja saponaria]|uniref:Nucleotide-diphospho-sugar transferase n=1 Tax=Quillaja saponaria TaxID=32244 RepID=A0AAD7L3N4_QUISA|nr:Nucleotide-diphospho-sugar transferase [Quillaja saponaria]
MRVCSGWRQFLLCLPLVFFLPYLLSVMELHQNPKMEEPHKKIGKKFDHLVLGPAAGQGLSNRLQCQGNTALNKTHFSAPKHGAISEDHIAVVTVFTIYNSSLNMLNVFINFIQATMPQSNVVILTDPASDLSLHRNRVSVYPIQGEYSRDQLMLQRIRSYITFLETRLEEGNNKAQPLNSGFIAVRGTRDGILRAKIFLQEVLRVYISKYMNASRMLEGAGQFHGMPLDVKVIHFKGSRKRLMLESWNFFSSHPDIADMLCLILRSGRTKYDF